MTDAFIQLTEDEFDDRFQLVPNHLNPNASWGYGENGGCLFETYGEELEFVRRQDPKTIWTFVDGDDGGQYVVSGYHLVNRIGYLISTEPVPDGTQIEVCIESPQDDDPEPPAYASPAGLLSRIAAEQLRIPTLETRRSDSLDFHTVAVWAVRDALQAAYDAGRSSAFPEIDALRSACQLVVDRWQRGDLAEAARACQAVLSSTEASTAAVNSSTGP